MKGERILEIEFASDLMGEAVAVRFEVFVDEQGVPRELEADEFDPLATHLVAIRDDQVVGTLRMLEHCGAAKIGRVAVRAAGLARVPSKRRAPRKAREAQAYC